MCASKAITIRRLLQLSPLTRSSSKRLALVGAFGTGLRGSIFLATRETLANDIVFELLSIVLVRIHPSVTQLLENFLLSISSTLR